METYNISSDFKLVLNESILKRAGFNRGQRIKIEFSDNKLEIHSENDKKSLKGFLKGIDTNINREEDRI